MFKIDLAGLIVFFINREVHNPCKGKSVLLGQTQLVADDDTGTTRNGLEHFRLAAKEEGRVADAQAQLLADRFGTLGADVLGQRAGRFVAQGDLARFDQSVHLFDGDATLLRDRVRRLLAPEDVTHARQPLFLRERVHAVTELAAAATRRGDRADLGAFLLQKLGEDREAGAAEMLGDDLHLDRVAQVGLVGAVPQRRVLIGNLRPVFINLMSVAKLFEDAL